MGARRPVSGNQWMNEEEEMEFEDRMKMIESVQRERPEILLEALRRFLSDYDEKIHPLVEAEVNGTRN